MTDPWWKVEDSRERATGAVNAARGIRDRQSQRRAWLTLAYALYGDLDAFDLSPTGYGVERTASEVQTVLNVVRACADTVRAELIQSRPRPMFMPSGADFAVRKKCAQLGRFIEGLYTDDSFDRTASAVAMDTVIFGTGIVRTLLDQGRPRLERVMPWEVWVDEQDGYYGRPRALYLLRYVSRDELAALYPDSEPAIKTALADDRRWTRNSDVDQVPVVEAWHLPTTDDSGDGWHVIAIDGEMLFEEAWEHSWFPFSFMRWKTPLAGFWGNGLAAELYEIQCDINRVVEAVQIGQRLNTWPRLAVPRAAQVNTEQLTDEPGTMFEYSGPQPPTALVWPGCPPEIYSWLTSQIEWAFRLSGVSMAAASAQKSPGLTSGRAIQLESNLQSRRFVDVQRAFEQLYLDTARTVVGVMEHEAANDNAAEVEVVWRGKYRAERIKWSQARLEESGYVIRLTPVSALASSPAGRVDQISGLMNSGFAQQAGAPLPLLIRAMESPDTESLLGPISAAYDLVERICDDLLEGEDARRPEPFFNLSVCLLVGVLTYQQWCLWDVPEDRLDALRDWLDEVREMAEEAAAAQPPTPQGAPAPPPPAAAA